ncbi:MAG TPA: malto-oligosyltrehalose synthase, partial [Rhodopila sp.]|nr:malto-oligosyltrehalose synthase [Rhodopila sp.]
MIHARPRATLRLQFHKDFAFGDAEKLIPYITRLGISHVYASPILTARPGSLHGYDVVDPTTVNQELGGEDGFRRFVASLRRAELGLIVDIVPNHMAVGGSENLWWADVLRHGRKSRYSTFFDIDWDASDPMLRDKVLAPFLGRPYGEALDAGEIKLSKAPTGEPAVDYFGSIFPINPSEFTYIEESGWESFDPRNQSGRTLLHELLERQHYRLAWWGVAGDEINWRRFFDINGLAGLRMEVPEVFEETHATLFRLYAEGLIDGFRIDHVDGLSDPGDYCRRLRQRLSEFAPFRPASAARGRPYIIVEKILGNGESLPEDWSVDGTSGYDFMNEVSALQHDVSSQATLEALWHDITGRSATFESEEITARKEILDSNFHAQLKSVASALHGIARADIHTRDTSLAAIQRGLTQLLAHFPIYRTYNAGQKRSASDEQAVRMALDKARASTSVPVRTVLYHLDRWLGGQGNPAYKVAQTRFQQLSAPVSAKAVEDTAFYRYGRLLSRNDVGFDAARLGGSIEEFHQACQHRLKMFPDAMLATATHDHKRGEDLRARLAVLSELPEEWLRLVSACRALNEAERPDPTDELMLYQTIVG